MHYCTLFAMLTQSSRPISRSVAIAISSFLALQLATELFQLAQYSSSDHGGSCTKEYESVCKAFEANFARGLERDGAHFAVYHKSKLKVNIWAGYADSESERKWTPDTRTVLFSATKAISALCVAVLVDRGFVSYNDPVVRFWPAYGANGKDRTTVEDILTHQAGLPFLEEPILIEHAKNVSQILRMIEQAKPLWEPGTASGYHAITYGWLVDGLVRKVDPFGRDLRTFFREEIAEPHGLDMDIGVEREELHRMARMTQPGILEYARDIIKDPRMLAMLALMYVRPSDSYVWKVRDNTEWLPLNYDTVPFNDPEILQLSIGSASGVGNANNIAKLFSLALDGSLISNSTLKEISSPTLDTWHWEKVVIWPVSKGHGFFYDAHPVLGGKHVFGHPGYGCQTIHIDPDNDLTVAYVTNGLKTATSELCQPYQRLLAEVYRSL
uniref:Beta-lactamase domain-containing protein n=1 Tax=Steinernema glaseri TaxID=37863 RepID=A0A1I7ZDZ7_9BILA